MSLSTLLGDLFSGSDGDPDLPTDNTGERHSDGDGDGDAIDSVTVVRECRHCGTNVSAGTAQCPTCEGDEIVTYSIE